MRVACAKRRNKGYAGLAKEKTKLNDPWKRSGEKKN
jgi:hypothetical protein